MSRHHLLPPLAYVPPQPKKIEKPRRRRPIGDVDETEEVAGGREATPASRMVPAAAPPKPNLPEIEGAGRKPHNPASRLSESTLSAMLRAQESE